MLINIKVISAGFNAGNYAEILLNGKSINMMQNERNHDRGLHLVFIDIYLGSIELAIVFDTYESSHELDKLIDTIDFPEDEGIIVAAACKDDCIKAMSHKSKQWFADMGSTEIWNLEFR